MGPGVFAVELDGAVRQCRGVRVILTFRYPADMPGDKQGKGEQAVGRTVIRVKPYGFAQHDDCSLALVRRHPPEVRQRAHDEIPCAEILRRALLRAHSLGGDQLRLDGRRDALGQVVLEGENIGDLAIVVLRPNMGAAGHVDELGGDSHAIPGFSDAALKDVLDAELPADSADVDRDVLVNES